MKKVITFFMLKKMIYTIETIMKMEMMEIRQILESHPGCVPAGQAIDYYNVMNIYCSVLPETDQKMLKFNKFGITFFRLLRSGKNYEQIRYEIDKYSSFTLKRYAFYEWSKHWVQFIIENEDIMRQEFDFFYDDPDIDFSIDLENFNIEPYLLIEYPNLPWDYFCHDSTKSLYFCTWDFICKFPHLSWGYDNLSAHRCITLEIMLSHPQYPWNYQRFLRRNKNCSLQSIFRYIDVFYEKGLTLDDICECYSYNVTYEELQKYPEFGKKFDKQFIDTRCFHLSYYDMSNLAHREKEDLYHNINLNLEFVNQHSEFSWNLSRLDYHILTWDFIQNHPDVNWDIYAACILVPVTLEYIDQHPEILWDWECLTQNASFTYQTICDHPQYPWDLSRIDRQEWCTIDLYKTHIQETLPYLETNFQQERISFVTSFMRKYYQTEVITELVDKTYLKYMGSYSGFEELPE